MSGICLLLKLLCLQKQKAVPSARENITFIAVYQRVVIINTFYAFRQLIFTSYQTALFGGTENTTYLCLRNEERRMMNGEFTCDRSTINFQFSILHYQLTKHEFKATKLCQQSEHQSTGIIKSTGDHCKLTPVIPHLMRDPAHANKHIDLCSRPKCLPKPSILNFQFSIKEMDKKTIWKTIIQTLVTILTAIGTTLGVTSCM